MCYGGINHYWYNFLQQSIKLEGMQRLLAEAMMQGALGLSSGLIYPPGAFAQKEELKALCEVVAKYHGIYTTHMRNESKHVVEAVKEAVGIARETGAALNISHIKVMGMDNWGLSERILEEIEAARRDGVSVTMDLYPYKATSTMLNVCIPPQFFKDGRKKLLERLADKSFRAELKAAISDPDQEYDNNYISCRGFENILVAKARKSPAAEGRRIAEYAAEKGVDPFDLYFDLLMENELEGAAVYFCIGEDDISNFIRDPLCVIGTDGICLGSGGAGHPRAFGTFPHAIEWFVKDKRLFSMSEMIYKMTGKTAERALSVGLFCGLRHEDNFPETVRAAANHGGDSSVTASVAGQIVGACIGREAIPAELTEKLELSAMINDYGMQIGSLRGCL